MSSLSIANYFPFAGVKVVQQAVHPDASGTLVYLEPDQRYRPRCHDDDSEQHRPPDLMTGLC